MNPTRPAAVLPYHRKKRISVQRRNPMMLRLLANRQEMLHEGVAMLSLEGVILEASQRVGYLLGGECGPLVGRSFFEFLDLDTAAFLKGLMEFARYSQSKAGPVELVVHTPEARTVSTSLVYCGSHLSEDGSICIVLNDISAWVEMKQALEQARFELQQSYSATLEGWAKTLELRDLETKGHAERVTRLSVNLALEMGFSLTDLDTIRHGALLHDIGKIAIPDAILLKPGALSAEEWVLMRQHPLYAFDLLKSVDYLQSAINIPYNHHEKWDGSGYPRGLAGDEIPLEARIFAVVDVLDAVTNPRPYRKEVWSRAQAREHIQSGAGTHFDPEVVTAFMDVF